MSAAQSANVHYEQLLGWKPSDFGGTANDELLVALITAKQQLWGETADGIAGPNTYGRKLKTELAELQMPPAVDDDEHDPLVVGGKIAVHQGKILWLTTVLDLPTPGSSDYTRCRDIIDRMIRTPSGINWSFQDPYEHNYEWCGTYAAYCWGAARLALSWRYNFFSSTYRLDRWARYKVLDPKGIANPKPPQGPYRMIIELEENSPVSAVKFPDGTAPRAGDILLVGMRDSDYGSHITVVEGFDPVTGYFTTLEGNGTGNFPNGTHGHGVVRAIRPTGIPAGASARTYHARRLIRVAPSDLA